MSDIKITSGEYEACLREKGAGLNWLRYKERDLVDPYQPSDRRFFRGDVLAPWPNRIDGGIYTVDNVIYKTFINEPDRNTALHGLIFDLNWKVTSQSHSLVKFEVDLPASEAYPTSLHFIAVYSLSHEGLEITISAQNIGNIRAPYGVSIHPYLTVSRNQSVNEWTLQLPSTQVLEVDRIRLLPIALRNCPEMDFEFQEGATIEGRFIDHAFKIDKSSARQISLKSSNGDGVLMSFDESAKWIQIHTADRDGGVGSRSCLAVEPMTCPPNAFTSGEDLIWLSEGDSTQTTWKIKNLEGEI